MVGSCCVWSWLWTSCSRCTPGGSLVLSVTNGFELHQESVPKGMWKGQMVSVPRASEVRLHLCLCVPRLGSSMGWAGQGAAQGCWLLWQQSCSHPLCAGCSWGWWWGSLSRDTAGVFFKECEFGDS